MVGTIYCSAFGDSILLCAVLSVAGITKSVLRVQSPPRNSCCSYVWSVSR